MEKEQIAIIIAEILQEMDATNPEVCQHYIWAFQDLLSHTEDKSEEND